MENKRKNGYIIMVKKAIFIGLGISIVFGLMFGAYTLMNSRSFQLFGGLTEKVETTQKVAALTFDDGPTNNLEDILAILDQYNAKATFFLIGKEMESNSDEAKKIVKAGHQIGNHTYSHNRMVFKSSAYIKQEIEKTDELIREAGFEGEIDFRPPNGKKLVGLPYYLSKKRRDTITWTIEPDSYYSTPFDKVKYVRENIEPGAIILMHPMYDDTGNELRAIEGILKELTEEGYKFVTVNELQEI
jgi:peptidoglycan-N-acetylglucosamine deacetylase